MPFPIPGAVLPATKYLRIAAVLAAAMLPAIVPGRGWASVAEPRKVTCYDDLFAPYFMKHGDSFTGLNVDVVTEAGKRIGITVEFQAMPFKRIEREMQAGKDSPIECAFAFSRTPEREAYMEFGTVPLQVSDYTLFVRQDESDVGSLDDLAGKSIGVRRGFRVPETIEAGEKAGRFKLEPVDTDDSNFLKLARRHVAAVLTIRDVGFYMVGQLQLDGIRALSPPVQHLDNFLVFAKGKPAAALAPEFDRALAQMLQDGTYANLRGKYLSAP